MVSPLCLGAMSFGRETDEQESIAIIHRALDAGINIVDTANVYNAGESERIVGRALKESGCRDQVVVATKFYFHSFRHSRTGDGSNDEGASRYHIVQACEDSLCRLQTDHIDLYQVHRPPLTVPQDETLRALDDLIHAGKVRYIGTSTYPAWMVMEALAISERYGLARYVSEQSPYNLVDRRIENELIPLCQKYGLAILPWAPLGHGTLAGRYPLDGEIPSDSRVGRGGGTFGERMTLQARQVAAQVVEMAQGRGMTAAQLSLLWLKDQPGVTAPIIGPRTMTHMEEAIAVLDMTLDDADRPLFDKLVHPGNAVADFFATSGWTKSRIVE